MHSSRMRTARSSSHLGGGGGSPPGHSYGFLVWWPSGVVAFCYGLLVWWSFVMAFCPPPRRPYQKATFNQKATKSEGHNRHHNRRPHSPRADLPQGQAPPGANHPRSRPPGPGTPPKTCYKACWDTTCNACWDSTPLWRPAARYAGIPPVKHGGIAPPC